MPFIYDISSFCQWKSELYNYTSTICIPYYSFRSSDFVHIFLLRCLKMSTLASYTFDTASDIYSYIAALNLFIHNDDAKTVKYKKHHQYLFS